MARAIRRDRAAAAHGAASRGASAPRTAPARRVGDQVNVLAARYARIFVRDRRNVLILVGQVPLIALAVGALFPSGVFAAGGSTADASQLLFLLVTVVIWLGAIDAAREVVKERSVLNARPRSCAHEPYLASKRSCCGG